MLWCSDVLPLQTPTPISWWYYSPIAHYCLVCHFQRTGMRKKGQCKEQPNKARVVSRHHLCWINRAVRVPHSISCSKALLSIHPHSSSSWKPLPSMPQAGEELCVPLSLHPVGAVEEAPRVKQEAKAPVPLIQSSAGMRFSSGQSR